MNINLTGNYPVDSDGQPESFLADIDDHIASMVAAGYPLSPTHDHVLVPEGPEFPGSYQIWLKVIGDSTHMVGWIYVDPDGVVNHRQYPGATLELPRRD